ncbi:N-carbamoyl-L-amino acid hydrolase [anaerobic digester metagenome]|nr:Zn-dependent hydrolase [Clostridiaceae bacterium HFYG-1003]
MLKINQERLGRRLEELAQFGGSEQGMNRFSYTKEEKDAQNYLKEVFAALGMTVTEDPLGNLFARYEGLNPELKPIVTGSHIDSVRNGGRYDGNLGVLGALEAVQCLHEQGIRLNHPIVIFISKDEEGTRFGSTMFGTEAMLGALPAEFLDRTDRDGITLRQAMTDAGYDPQGIFNSKVEPGSYAAYLELHIEQARVLETMQIPIGIVTGIAGPLWFAVNIKGQAGHAGSTPMRIRHDPMVAAARLIDQCDRIARQFQDTVATTGYIKADPGTTNVIPAQVDFTIDLRDVSMADRDQAEAEIKAAARLLEEKMGVTIEFSDRVRTPSVLCNDALMNVIEETAGEFSLPSLRMPSGACHDAMHFGPLCPIGMIFVPSVNGYSHRADEYTPLEDCANGANVLLNTLVKADALV